ncbi:cell division protein FtsH [Bdellovibrio sp. qaytius]|nr:cell division protein FtsH [Bdellovibrio sp. qaytius]
MKANQKTLALWFFILIMSIFVFQAWEIKRQKTIVDFDYPKFLKSVELKEVKDDSIIFMPDAKVIRGEIKPEFEKRYAGHRFEFSGDTDKAYEEIKKFGYIPKYENAQSDSFLSSFFINWLPLLLIVGMFIFIMRQIQSGGGKAMSFGKSRARLVENKNRVMFKDVAGVDEAKDDLQEIVHFLKDPKKFTKLGGRIPKGVLLVGPPGTGKTLLARAVAGEAGAPFFTISGSDFVEMFVGVGASRVRDLFEQGKKNAPCLIFIDEIDAVGRHRGAGMGGGHDEREQTLNQLLVEMDGFESTEGVILIAATNRPDVLDPALLRPGRFDRRVVVGKPDLKGREHILTVHMKKTPLGPDVDVTKIARGTPGFSGADLENLVNEAALVAARSDKKYLEMEDFEKAKDKVIMGAERKSMVISEEDRKNTAYHEAGHTLVGIALPGLDPIHKVTIIPRGMALGLTQTLPEKDAVSFSKRQAENWIAFAFGGRAAEELIFTDYTTGAANDIERATGMARKMVTEWGMSPLGPIGYESNNNPVFLGMGHGNQQKNYSEAKAQEIDAEISRIINTGYETAVKVLRDNREALEKITQALLEFETIDGAEVDMLYKGAAVSEIHKVRANKKESNSSSNSGGNQGVIIDPDNTSPIPTGKKPVPVS